MWNWGDVVFDDVLFWVGLFFFSELVGCGVVVCDFDNDGDLDVMVMYLYIFVVLLWNDIEWVNWFFGLWLID